MRPALLILRPQPGADKTARAARAEGFATVVAPLFDVRPVAWAAPDPAQLDALMLTSANAVRHAGPQLERLRALPAYVVGQATAAAARGAGLDVQRVGEGDAEALLALAPRDGAMRVLHLAGRDHRPAEHAGVTVTRHIVYAADPISAFPERARKALADGAVALLHSPRAAELFHMHCTDAPLKRAHIRIAVLSKQVAEAAGGGWAAIAIADRPTDDALLAAAARLCDG